MKKCRCGVKKVAGHRWRVLNRADDIKDKSLLKCLECGHKWKSRCKYVSELANHKEKSRRGMTDADILSRLNDETLVVDPLGEFVISQFLETKYLAIWERPRNGSCYRFISICQGGRKKKIAAHRLVWMSHHRTLVPDGFDVDHINGRGIPHPDSINNLRLLPVSVNRSNADFVTEEVF